tara:strand:- start:988 stop:1428 length:441 start_codon:yes stop_codon:yes gene_type:complete
MDPLQALLIPFKSKLNNIHTYTIFTEEKDIVAIFGVMPTVKNPSNGRVWFLASDLLLKHYIHVLKRNKKWLSYLEEHYSFLSNYIIEENKTSINWLKWQGFQFQNNGTLVKGVKILYFYKKLHTVAKYGTQPILDELGPIWTTNII